jgi:hypothetical protein
MRASNPGLHQKALKGGKLLKIKWILNDSKRSPSAC